MKSLTARRILLITAVAAAYFVAGKLGLQLAYLHPNTTPVWPPTGIAFAALLLFGYEVWPGILLGAFVTNVTTSGSVVTSAAIGAGNTLEGLAGAWLVHRFARGREVFDRAPDIFRFFILTAMGSAVIAATIGEATLALTNSVSLRASGEVWLTWWLGDVVSYLTVAPLVLLWAKPADPAQPRRSLLELISLFLAVLAVGLVVFGGAALTTLGALPLDFLCIPVLIWAAYRFSRRAAVTAVVVLSAVAIWGTLQGEGPFARAEPNQSLLLLQAFLGASAGMTLVLTALVGERRETLQQLEGRVEQRTSDLRTAVTRLQDAQEALVRHERLALLGELAGGVGHELRNPLGVMTNATYYLSEVLKTAPADVRRHLDILSDQIHLSDRIVGNLLDLARDRQPQRQAVSLPDLVATQLTRAGAATGIVVKTSFPPALPAAFVDEVQVGQIVLNVVTNAMQAMESTGGMLEIRAHYDTRRLTLEIADAGPGIAPANLEKIFEPLFTTKARGMGLGLAVSRSLARANGGELAVWSEEGRGARFSLTLPAAP